MMRTVGPLTAGVLSMLAVAVLDAPTAGALPNCGMVAPWTMQCEHQHGVNTSINSSPNPWTTPGPFLEQPWLNPGWFGIGGWGSP